MNLPSLDHYQQISAVTFKSVQASERALLLLSLHLFPSLLDSMLDWPAAELYAPARSWQLAQAAPCIVVSTFDFVGRLMVQGRVSLKRTLTQDIGPFLDSFSAMPSTRACETSLQLGPAGLELPSRPIGRILGVTELAKHPIRVVSLCCWQSFSQQGDKLQTDKNLLGYKPIAAPNLRADIR